VVSDGHGGHLAGLGLFHQLFDLGGAVEEAEFGVSMKVDERHGEALWLSGLQNYHEGGWGLGWVFNRVWALWQLLCIQMLFSLTSPLHPFNMKNFLFLLSLLLLFSSLQGQYLDWANGFAGSNECKVGYLATDALGNVYSTGLYNDTTDFDPGPGVNNLVTLASKAAFVVKTDSLGHFLWARNIGDGATKIYSYAIAVDPAGNVLIGGAFSGNADFDPGPGTFWVDSSGLDDMFLLKLDPAGNFVWAMTAGDNLNDRLYALYVDPAGNIYAGGLYGDSVDFDAGPGVDLLVSPGASRGFVMKLDASGNHKWAKGISGGTSSFVKTIMDTDGSEIFVSGFTSGLSDFDPGPGVVNEDGPFFFEEIDTAGNLAWVKGIAASASNTSGIDADKHHYYAGSFFGTADFDPGPGTFNMSTTGSADCYILKTDSLGNFVWAKSLNDVTEFGIIADDAGNSYVTGWFTDTVDFDPGPGIYNLYTSYMNQFVLKLDPMGNFVWIYSASGTGSTGNDFAFMPNGDLLTCGFYSTGTDFDPGPGTYLLPAGTVSAGYVLKFTEDACSGFVLSLDSVPNISCASGTSISAASAWGGTPPYSYLWSTTPPTTDSVVTITTEGLYTVTVSDAAGCERERTVLVNGAEALVGFDLRVNFALVGTLIPGLMVTAHLDAMNDGCTPTASVLKFRPDPYLHYVSASPAPSSISGDTLIWNLAPMDYTSPHFMPSVVMDVDTNADANSVLCMLAIIKPTAGHIFPSNNVRYLCRPVLAPCDPNDKFAFPLGECEEHFVEMGTILSYTIQFQNVGTSEAVNVVILDTLDAKLDLSTLSVKAQSHSMFTEVLPGNILRFVFNDIHLPDSSTDLAGSKGFLLYDISPMNTVASGDRVENRAAIFFDFNPAVITTTVHHTYMDSIPPCTPLAIADAQSNGLNVSVFPNPATDRFTITANQQVEEVTVLNLQGQVVASIPGKANAALLVDVSEWPQGLYLVGVRTPQGTHWVRVAVQH
jgi:uncharacterized repeat protein (TIGR01451 family)